MVSIACRTSGIPDLSKEERREKNLSVHAGTEDEEDCIQPKGSYFQREIYEMVLERCGNLDGREIRGMPKVVIFFFVFSGPLTFPNNLCWELLYFWAGKVLQVAGQTVSEVISAGLRFDQVTHIKMGWLDDSDAVVVDHNL